MSADISAIIPAVGLSARTGEAKALLPLGQGSTLSHIISLFRSSGIEDIIVATGHGQEEVERQAVEAGVRCVSHPEPGHDMFAAIQTGIKALNRQCRGFFLMPINIPLVHRKTIRQLEETFLTYPLAVVYPAFQGRRGHPPLITASLSQHILNQQGAAGLVSLLEKVDRQSISSVMDLEVPDANILFDLDAMTDVHPGSALYTAPPVRDSETPLSRGCGRSCEGDIPSSPFQNRMPVSLF